MAWTVLVDNAEAILNANDSTALLISIVARQGARQDQTNRGIIDTGEGKISVVALATDWELDQAEPARDLDLRGTDVGLDDLAG